MTRLSEKGAKVSVVRFLKLIVAIINYLSEVSNFSFFANLQTNMVILRPDNSVLNCILYLQFLWFKLSTICTLSSFIGISFLTKVSSCEDGWK